MKIVEYAKSHPWIAGIVVVIGGIVFLSISGAFSGGGSGGSASTGPSDSEIAANAAITAAQIQAQAQTASAAAGIQAASIGAGVQLNSDKLAAETARASIDAQREVGLATLEYQFKGIQSENETRLGMYDALVSVQNFQTLASRDVNLASISANENSIADITNAQNVRDTAILGSLGTLKKKDRDNVVQALITGQVVPGGQGVPSGVQYINAGANAIGSLASAAAFF